MTNIHKAAREALIAVDALTSYEHFGSMDGGGPAEPEIVSDGDWVRRSDLLAALATLRAALSEAPGEERDERAAFEDWIAPTLRNGSHLNRSRVNQVYTDNRVAAKWAAWQARAMLAARPEAKTVALTAPAGLSNSDAQFWLDRRQQITEAARREGYTIVTTASGVSLMRLGKIEAQGKEGGA